MMNYQEARFIQHNFRRHKTTERMLFLQSERPVACTTTAARGFQGGKLCFIIASWTDVSLSVLQRLT